MSIKILHTADNHIGMRFSNHKPPAIPKLIEERFSALKKIVQIANNKKVNYLTIGGDLFDSTTVKLTDIKATAEILNQFQGDTAIIIPGNHDFYESAADGLWAKFKKYADERMIFVLSEYETFEHEIGEQKVNFYPAGCRSKHSDENMIGWVKDAIKDKKALNIGIAHGNVTGLGLDEGDKYFNMTMNELKDAGLDFWLLGHIHVPFPITNSVTQNPVFFMPGTHTPDGRKRTQPGSCWLIETDENKNVNAELLELGELRFYVWERTISSAVDLDRLKIEISSVNKAKSLMYLTVNGRLSQEDLAILNDFLEEANEDFLEFISSNFVKLNIDSAYINKNYIKDSLPYNLLTGLSAEDPEGVALLLANDLIEELKN